MRKIKILKYKKNLKAGVKCKQLYFNPNIFFCIILAVEPLKPPHSIPNTDQMHIVNNNMYTLYVLVLWNLMYYLIISPNTSGTKFMALIQWHLWCYTKQTWRSCLASNNKPLSICSCLIQRFSYTKMVVVQQPPVDLQQKIRVHLQCETFNFMSVIGTLLEQFLDVFVGRPFVFLRYTPEAPWCQIPDCLLPLIGRLTQSTAGS